MNTSGPLTLIRARVLAAVHQQVLAGDVARVRAAQEGAGRAEFLGRAETAGRIHLGAGGVLLVVALAALGSARLVGAAQAGGTDGDSLMTMRLFHLSIVYLTVVFAAVAVGVFIR